MLRGTILALPLSNDSAVLCGERKGRPTTWKSVVGYVEEVRMSVPKTSSKGFGGKSRGGHEISEYDPPG